MQWTSCFNILFPAFFLYIVPCLGQSSEPKQIRHLPQIKIDDFSIGLYPFFELLDEYARHKIGIIDSVEWTNNEEGEGFEASIIYNLKGGHGITKLTYYEHWSTTYDFRNVKTKEVLTLFETLLKQADRYHPYHFKQLQKTGHASFRLEDMCCYVEMETNPDGVKLTFLPDDEE